MAIDFDMPMIGKLYNCFTVQGNIFSLVYVLKQKEFSDATSLMAISTPVKV